MTAAKAKRTKNAQPVIDVQSPEFIAAVKAAVAEQIALSTPAAVVEKVSAPVDPVAALVEKHGLSFARGGRAYLSLAAAQAMVRVLRTGTPELVKAAGEPSEVKRSITHVVLFRTESGNVGIHPLFQA